ncbi:hypothetical protein IX317_000577 [Fusobacterium sp. DD29]|uniref:LicD family protein n=1 Tax=unclassified Fusobacterium TaxID=2648384 RepID=UPI001B8BA3CE|nr:MULTISPECIES: LicD family protein [unclassified Fusobacterium]MBR8700684.1 hypothetical protein [Fusobacterium sp. DD45]MBR8710775.1 hypothetical protein [Fusobacterium sp. DD28]MBR8748916.1 hypothetical protein [Fusobacterium sp. DD29]MBR8751383.1 hypothetical protein [Fusobacterium sp. DD26]MBR8761182.1 hypothetical protein [Fusobacterium sp. DD25]
MFINSRKIFDEIKKKKCDQYILTTEELKLLQQCLLKVLTDVLDSANKSGIKVMLGGGSLLGAVRHKGFIPWDDDVDLMIFRKDYEKLLQQIESDYGNKYFISRPNDGKGNTSTFAKVIKPGIKISNLTNFGSTYPQGITIEIFPIDNLPKSKLLIYRNAILCKILSFLATSGKMNRFKNKILKDILLETFLGKLYYYLRVVLIGSLVELIKYEKLNNLFDRIVSKYPESSEVTVPTGRKGYIGEIQLREDMTPKKVLLFENLNVYVPNNYDKYLKKLYRNYMEIPPIEKREQHFYVEFDLREK